MILLTSIESNFNLSIIEKDLEKWLLELINNYKANVDSLSYVFCGDVYLHQLNKKFLNHDTYTDIITFQYNKKREGIDSEVYISVDRVKENALSFDVSFGDELLRVMAHGFLHLLGYDDKKKSDIEKMRLEEDKCINIASNILNETFAKFK